jgi:hypothetical protein
MDPAAGFLLSLGTWLILSGVILPAIETAALPASDSKLPDKPTS